MKLTKEEIEFIEDCLTFYMENEERFVSYDEHMETSRRVKEIMDKISTEIKRCFMWRYDKPPSEEYVIVSCRDETGDTPYSYTSVGWYFNGLWVVDNAPCSCVIAWMELPKPII